MVTKENSRVAAEHYAYLKEHGRTLYVRDNDITYEFEPMTEENVFIHKEKDTQELPVWEASRDRLPALIWEGRKDAVACYDKAWEIAFRNLRTCKSEDAMVSNYIDTAFNGFLFMWDSSFITMFGKYASRVFDFQKTLDNFYARQHMDGYICREISEETPGEQFHRHDPASTGPNILPWAEWESYLITGDRERISRVFPPLVAYHRWLRKNRTWPDGSYWSSGWGCGMDNMPRQQDGYDCKFSHGHMVWLDACIQQVLSCKILMNMASLLGREDDIGDMKTEKEKLTALINEKLWDEESGFYYDLWPDGRLNGVKTIGAYWALLAGIVPEERLDRFIAHLENEKEFKRPHRVPTLSADHPKYREDGGYWLGSIWAPTNYMVLKGLRACGREDLAYDIALNHVENVCRVFAETGTIWENYAPEICRQGKPAKSEFVGWSGLIPIADIIEFVFGIRNDAERGRLIWHIRRSEKHGILRYPIAGGTADLICPAFAPGEKPKPEMSATAPVNVLVIYPDGTREEFELGRQVK